MTGPTEGCAQRGGVCDCGERPCFVYCGDWSNLSEETQEAISDIVRVAYEEFKRDMKGDDDEDLA